MIILYTQSAAHLTQDIQLPRAEYQIKQFSDGELYIKVDPRIVDQEIWIIVSTQSPAENILELFFLLDALNHAGAQNINLFFTYFGYARQTAPCPGEASSGQLLCKILKSFPTKKCIIMHAHASRKLHTMLNFIDAIDMDFFADAAQEYDVIAAPDKGIATFAKEVAQTCNKEIVFLHKRRPEHEQVHIESIDGVVKNKKVLLVDDMISTGRTLTEAACVLKKAGALDIAAAATHGIFSDGASERLAKSNLTSIYVTNTLKQKPIALVSTIYNVGPFIQKLIEEQSSFP